MTTIHNKSTLEKIFVSYGVLVYACLIPFLEINNSHVFNPAWPPHARLHEVWQLTTHFFIGSLCLWLIWIKSTIVIPAILGIAIMGGVLFAHTIESTYGGSINSGNLQSTIWGFELAALVAFSVVTTSGLAIILNISKSK